jgi:hypothetical protein
MDRTHGTSITGYRVRGKRKTLTEAWRKSIRKR